MWYQFPVSISRVSFPRCAVSYEAVQTRNSYSPAPTISEFSSEVSVQVSSFPSPPSTREAENLRGTESGSGSVRRIRALTALGQRLPERASSEPLRPHPAHTSRDSRPSLGHTGVNRVFCFASHLVGVAPQTGRRTKPRGILWRGHNTCSNSVDQYTSVAPNSLDQRTGGGLESGQTAERQETDSLAA